MNYKAIFFDFDLTLVDSSMGVYQCMNYAFGAMGFQKKEFESIKKTIGHTLVDSFYMLTGSQDESLAKSFVEKYVAHADLVMNQKTFVYPEVFEIIPFLKSCGHKLCIISTKYRYRIEEILKREELQDYFDLIIGGEDVSKHKPDPEGILLAMNKLDLKKEEVLFIGDSLIDRSASINAATSFCAVLTGTTSKEEFKSHGVMDVIEHLGQLYNLV